MGRGTTKNDRRRGWQQWTEAEARAALKELAASGLSAESFARSKGYSTQRLRYWKKRLMTSGLVPFVAVPLPVSTRSSVMAGAHIEIAWGDVVLRVREDLDVEHLARIAFALAGRTRRC